MTDNTPPAQGQLSQGAVRYGLFMLFLVYAFNFVDRQILVILQEPIKNEMGLSDVQLGLLSGFSFALVYITAGIPIAYWADRSNRRNIIALALAVWSGMTALSGLAQNYTQLLLARIGVGIGEAGCSPPAHSIISDYFPPERRATAMAIYSTGLHLGVLMGLVVGGVISQMYGWRIAFYAVGLPGIALAVVFFLTVKEPMRGRWDAAAHRDHKPTVSETVRALRGYRSFWYISVAAGCAAFIGYGAGNFTPSYLIRNHGLSVGEVGVLLAVLAGGGGMVGTFLGGFLADRLGERDRRWYLWLPALAGFLAIPFAFPYLLSDNTAMVLPLLFVVTVLINTYMGPSLATIHALVPPAMRATTSAVFFFILNLIGLGLGPVTVGLLSDLYAQHLGQDSLRYAMLSVNLLGGFAILFFLLGARNLEADLARSGSAPPRP